jgi:hypothetical protein
MDSRLSSSDMALSILILLVFALVGCGKTQSDSGQVQPATPAQAAGQLERAFAQAPSELRANAETASQALRAGEFEKAVVALQSVREVEGVTLDQGLAIHGCVVTLEERLIRSMEAGDENAKRAYELLRRMKRH